MPGLKLLGFHNTIYHPFSFSLHHNLSCGGFPVMEPSRPLTGTVWTCSLQCNMPTHTAGRLPVSWPSQKVSCALHILLLHAVVVSQCPSQMNHIHLSVTRAMSHRSCVLMLSQKLTYFFYLVFSKKMVLKIKKMLSLSPGWVTVATCNKISQVNLC